MNCIKCGKPAEDGLNYCPYCGEPLPCADPMLPCSEGAERVSENVYLCTDGKYRWFYEFKMLKNPTILFTVWKVLGISFGIVFLFVAIIDCIDSVTPLESLLGTLKVFGILVGIFFFISLLAYFIVAATYGFKYCVLFEMDDKEISHIQMPNQFKKAQALSMLTILAGIAAGRPSIAGAGYLSASKATSTSVFENVRRVKLRPRRNTIHVNQLLNKNQIYAANEDFAFVSDYILARCVNARK